MRYGNAVFKDQTWLTHLAPTVVPDHEDDADKGEEKHKADHPEENVEADCHETWDMCPQIIHNGTYGWNIIILKFQFIFEINNCGWPFPSSIVFLLSMVGAAGQIVRLQTNRWRWWQPQSCHPSLAKGWYVPFNGNFKNSSFCACKTISQNW